MPTHRALPAPDFLRRLPESQAFVLRQAFANPTMSLTSSDRSLSLAFAKRYCSFLKSIVAPSSS